MAAPLFDRFRVIDIDTHITEPADLFTSRVASKWGDLVPHIKNMDGRDIWMIGDQGVIKPEMPSQRDLLQEERSQATILPSPNKV